MISNKLTLKYVLLLLLFVIPIVVILNWISYKSVASIIDSQTKEKSKLIIDNTINKIELIIKPIEKIPQNLASTYSENKNSLSKQLISGIKTNENIFGMAIAFEPFKYDNLSKKFSLYAYRKNNEIKITNLNSPDYDYFNKEWYQLPKKLKKPVWSEPYFDKGGGNVLMSTFSYPIIKNEKFIGVTTADISLKKINQLLKSIHILKTGYVFLISKKMKFIYHPNEKLVMQTNLQDYALKNNNKDLLKIINYIKQKKSGYLPFTNDKGKFKVYFRYMKSTNWYIGIVFPQNELFAPLKKLSKSLIAISLTGILLLIAVISLATRKITLRIIKLSKNVEKIAMGNFEEVLETDNSLDEIGKLSNSFEYMRKSILDYMENLKEVTASKQKIESELNIAREIQMSILPKFFPPFPEHKEFDIYATMEPAREVGGDLYDFFFLNERKFCFLIGDVSGKGVPASLFMAVTKTLIKATAEENKSAADILFYVNNELTTNNEKCMFVTLFMCIIDIYTGKLQYVNAGHNPPILIGKNNVAFIKNKCLPPLGVFKDVKYQNHYLKLNNNESILLYTDGVNEAFNKNSEQYSYERLLNQVKKISVQAKSKDIVINLIKDVKSFTKDTPQSDDITILNLKFIGIV